MKQSDLGKSLDPNVQAFWGCLCGRRPSACLVPLLLVSLLCAGILGLSRQWKGPVLLGTPTTSISIMCRHSGAVSPAEGPVPAGVLSAGHPYSSALRACQHRVPASATRPRHSNKYKYERELDYFLDWKSTLLSSGSTGIGKRTCSVMITGYSLRI